MRTSDVAHLVDLIDSIASGITDGAVVCLVFFALSSNGAERVVRLARLIRRRDE